MIPCNGCGRHHRVEENACPFCGKRGGGTSTLLRVAGGAVTTLVLSACYGGGGFDIDPIPTDTFRIDTFDPVEPLDPPVDADGDGYVNTSDCDDTNTAIHPDAIEDCEDTVDNDCDALIDGADPSCGPQSYPDDLDGDGYPAASDCDDDNAAIYPQAPEDCSDLIDNDCDLYIDGADPTCQ